MAKDKISDYSSTANSNTDIAGINIDEGCAPSGINDAIRTLMAQLKTWQSGGQDVYIHPAGSASAPSITANGDTNTGIFFPAADTIAFAEGGVEAMRLDSSGNLLVGTTTAVSGAKVTVSGSVAASAGASVAGNAWGVLPYTASSLVVDTNAGTSRLFSIGPDASTKGAILFYQSTSSGSATQAMTLDASGNFMVGTTTPLQTASNRGNITVNGSASSILNMGVNGSVAAYIFASSTSATYEVAGTNTISASGANVITLNTNGSERARIDSSGNLLVGTTNATVTSGAGIRLLTSATIPQVGVTVSTTSNNYLLYNSTAAAYRFFVSDAGQINATSTSITAISDASLKENVRDLETGLNEVMALKPRRFDWKEKTKLNLTNVAGFIAQEVEQVLPELVQDYQYNDNETKKSLKMGDILPTLVKAIQELNAKVDAQAAEIAALKG
jgi:hypothetical protein